MSARIQLRRGTTAQWSAANPLLADGEPGLDTDLDRLKFGDGVTPWSGLPWQEGFQPDVTTPTSSRLYRNAAYSLVLGPTDVERKIPFDTKSYDLGNCASVAAGADQGKYTCPANGLYDAQATVSVGVTAAIGTRYFIMLFKNGVECSRGNDWTIARASDPISMVVHDTISCGAGDKIHVTVYQSTGTGSVLLVGTPSYSFFSVRKVE